jgi:solute:Na+ symporter, SSS family
MAGRFPSQGLASALSVVTLDAMFGIPIPDLVVIGVYSLLMVVIGLVAMTRVKDQEDFFLGGRRFGKFLQTVATFGRATGSDSAVRTVTTTYGDGAGGIWSQLSLLWATPLYWFTAPWYRRMRVLTFGDFFHERYQSRLMALFYSLIACFVLVIVIGLGLKAVSVTVLGITLKPQSALTSSEQAEQAKALRLEALTEQSAQGNLDQAGLAELQSLRLQHPRREFSYINETWLVWCVAFSVLVYAVAGGLKAAVWAVSVQGALIAVLAVIFIPFGAAKLGALHGISGAVATGRLLHRELPGHFFAVFGSAQSADFTWYFIIALSVMVTLNIGVQSNQLTGNASAQDEFSARFGCMAGNFFKRFSTVLWGAVGLLAYALYNRDIQNSDLVWGRATRDLLGGAGFGLVGLVITCALAALQSSASTLIISCSSLLTRNVYEPLVPHRSDSHYIQVGRIAAVLILAASVLVCLGHDTVLEMLKFYWEASAIVAAAFWCGLKWRRATRLGAWASMLVAFVLYLLVPVGLPLLYPGLRTDERCLAKTRERTLRQVYAATDRDLELRQLEIDNWRGAGSPPPPLRVGQPVTRAFSIPPKAIYWAQGIREVDGVKRGEGIFHAEMFLLGQVVDLTANPNAFNETIRYGAKIALPFLVLIVVSLLTQPDNSPGTDRFFLRMRTQVRRDRQEDEQALQSAYANPAASRSTLLFPQSQFEFFKWDREDAVGFTVGCLLVLAVIGLLFLLLNLGA